MKIRKTEEFGGVASRGGPRVPRTMGMFEEGVLIARRLAAGFFVFLMVVGMSAPRSAQAQTVRTWTNNSATNNLSNAIVLWKGGANPASGDVWVFANPSNASLTNNFAAGFNVSWILFTNGAGVDVIGGNSIQLASGITNNSANLQTLNLAITVTNAITVAANSNAIVLGGSIMGAGGLNFTGTNITTLTASNGYTGVTTLNSNSKVNFTGSSSVGTNQLTLGSNTTAVFGGAGAINNLNAPTSLQIQNNGAVLTVSNGAVLNISRLSFGGGNSGGASRINLSSGGVIAMTNSADWYAAVGTGSSGNSLNLVSNNGGIWSNNLVLGYGGGTGATNRFVQGAGTTTLQALSLNIGDGKGDLNEVVVNGGLLTTTTITNTGTICLDKNANSSANTGVVNQVSNGGGLINTYGIQFGAYYTVGTSYAMTGSTNRILLGAGTTTVGEGGITSLYASNYSHYTNSILWNGGTLQAGGSSTNFIDNYPNTAVTVSNNGTFDVHGFSNEIAANIGGTGTLTVTNSFAGSGTLTLSGSNAFSGTTVIVGGVLNLGSSGSIAASTNIVISGGNLTIARSNQISTNAPVTLGAGTITLATSDSLLRSSGLKVSSLILKGPGVLDYSSLSGTSLVSIGALSGLGTNYAGGIKGILNVWNWDSSTNASTLLMASNSTNLTGLQLANINFYAGNGTLFLGSATLSSGGLRPFSSLVPNTPSLQVGGGSGTNTYAVTNAIGCINISLLGNTTITYPATFSTLSGSGSVTISGTNNVLSLSGSYPIGYFNVLISGSVLSISPGASFAVTGPAVGNTTLTVGQSYTNTNTWSIVTLQTNATSVFLAVSGSPQFHVSPSGADTNPGTAALPFATIQRAQQAVRDFRSTPVGSQQEVDVILHAGTYWQTNTLTFTNSDSGSPGAPVVYTNAPGDLVAISGGRVITGTWTQSPGKPYWQISIPDVQAGKWAFDTLTVNGQFATCARYPNVGEKELRGLGAEPGGDPLKSLVYHTGDFDPTWTNQQDISIVWMGNWTGEMHSVTSVDPVKQVLRFDNPSTVHTVYYYERLMRYYLRNVFEKLDSPGEWYLNKTTGMLYYYPRPGEDLSTAEVIAPVVKTPLVSISGNLASNLPVQYIQFKGIHFRHADTDIQAHDNMYRQGFMFLDGSVTATAFRNGMFQGCTFEQLGDYALNIADGCRDVTVQQCHFWDLGAGAVLIGVTDLTTLLTPAGSGSLAPGQAEPLRLVTNIVVDNNIVHRTGTIWNGPYGIVNRFASYTRITHNEIFDTDWTAIGLDARWDQSGGQVYAQGNEVAYNFIHHIGLNTQTDGGGIYQQGPMDTHIHHNIIHDSFPYPFTVGLEGIYCDANCLGVLAEKNILYNLQGNCFFQNISDSNAFLNNIGAFARDGFTHLGTVSTNEINYAQISGNVYVTTNSIAQKDGYPVGLKPSLVTSNFYQSLQTNATLLYNGNTLTNWQKLGWDIGSVEGNAGFSDPLNADFSMSPTAPPVTRTGFVPFIQEMTTVGLYGDSAWTSLPSTQPMRPLSQYQSVQDLSIYNEFFIDPNLLSNGVTMPVFNVDQTNCMIVTNGVSGLNGPKCIQAIENTNNALSYDPYAKLSLYGLAQGRVQVQLAFLQPTNAPAACTIEFRGSGNPYTAGPSITIASNGVLKAGKWTYQITPGQWNMFTITCGLGQQANGTYSLTLSNANGVTNTTQSFANTNFADMTSLVIYSGNTNSSGSYYLDALSLKTTPTALTDLIASNGVTNVTLNWSALSGNQSYLVQRSGSSNGVYTNLTPAFSGNSCTDVPPTAGVPYFYMVAATNPAGAGTAAGPVVAGLLPAAPSGLQATPATSQIALSWSPVSGATSGYSVKRSTSPGGPYTSLATGLTNATYTDAAVTVGSAYYYVVTAVNPIGESLSSSEVSAIPLNALQAWRLAKFGTTANSGNAADNANPSGDGIPNLMKYALGLDPLSANAGARPYAILTNGCLEMDFNRIADPSLVYAVEGSGDFSAWTNIWTSAGSLNTNGPVSVRDTNVPFSSNIRRFLRLRVTAP